MNSICGADCPKCPFNMECKGCKNTKGCPFGKKCFIAAYIEMGVEEYSSFKEELIKEINELNIQGMPKIESLYPLKGSYVNIEYTIPTGNKVKLLNDNEIYLGTQVESIFNDKDIKLCYGVVATPSFILVSSYEENGINPELITYKRR